MKEFAIQQRIGEGLPFILYSYKSYSEAYESVLRMVDYDKKKKKPYYCNIDNFCNDFPCYVGGRLYEILVRDVTEWEVARTNNNDNYNNYNNVVCFDFKQKKVLNSSGYQQLDLF